MNKLEVDVVVARRDFDVTARFVLEAGERLALFGPSGAGKTTVLEAVAGLVAPVSGEVRLGDAVLSRPPHAARSRRNAMLARRPPLGPTPSAASHVAMVRQPTALFPHLDVWQNLTYGDADPNLARALAGDLGLGGLERSRPAELSGGQAQRVVIGRALSRPHSLLLLDEPMSAVDRPTRPALWGVVADRLTEAGAGAILVTHDLAEAQAFGDRVALIDAGEIVAIGDPHDVVASPPTRRAAEIVGYEGWISASGAGVDSPAGTLEIGLDPRRTVAGHLECGELHLTGTIESCVPSGTAWEAAIALVTNSPVSLAGKGELRTTAATTIRVTLEAPMARGSTVEVTGLHVALAIGDTRR